jgi:hypothetical protein
MAAEDAVGKNFGTKSTPALQSRFGARTKSSIHPIAGARFLSATEMNSLDFKVHADQIIQAHPFGDYIPPKNIGLSIANRETPAQIEKNLLFEKGDLSFKVGFVAKKTIANDPLACHATNFIYLESQMLRRGLLVVAKKVMSA